MEIVDDGCGFNQYAIAPGGMGLQNMQERIRALNGTFELDFPVQGGTRIKVSALLNQVVLNKENEYDQSDSSINRR